MLSYSQGRSDQVSPPQDCINEFVILKLNW